MENAADSRVADWMLMSNPFSLLGIIFLYLLFVLRLGPLWMKNRKPYSLNKIMICYNIFMSTASGTVFYGLLTSATKFSLGCEPHIVMNDPKSYRVNGSMDVEALNVESPRVERHHHLHSKEKIQPSIFSSHLSPHVDRSSCLDSMQICPRWYVAIHDYAKLHRARDYVHLLSARLLGPRSAKEDRALETIHYGFTNDPYHVWYVLRLLQEIISQKKDEVITIQRESGKSRHPTYETSFKYYSLQPGQNSKNRCYHFQKGGTIYQPRIPGTDVLSPNPAVSTGEEGEADKLPLFQQLETPRTRADPRGCTQPSSFRLFSSALPSPLCPRSSSSGTNRLRYRPA
ncbi:Elongation of very long chain fatty acids protein [Apis cerana cerana]|uniref:Elongation of very long chain fatty acids protein n=1 Tax=Apis cerana cerana TaxID=94128 RepID=A0A2A3EHY0_APICC|nr:Elongation of very long chain fatty acids protein [Apis cerana cerana]